MPNRCIANFAYPSRHALSAVNIIESELVSWANNLTFGPSYLPTFCLHRV